MSIEIQIGYIGHTVRKSCLLLLISRFPQHHANAPTMKICLSKGRVLLSIHDIRRLEAGLRMSLNCVHTIRELLGTSDKEQLEADSHWTGQEQNHDVTLVPSQRNPLTL